METNLVKLNFQKDVTRLAGFPYGESVYEEQVKDNIDYSTPITLVFPNHIERIASSFVQGFFSEIIRIIGYKDVDERVVVKTGSQVLTDSIFRNLR